MTSPNDKTRFPAATVPTTGIQCVDTLIAIRRRPSNSRSNISTNSTSTRTSRASTSSNHADYTSPSAPVVITITPTPSSSSSTTTPTAAPAPSTPAEPIYITWGSLGAGDVGATGIPVPLVWLQFFGLVDWFLAALRLWDQGLIDAVAAAEDSGGRARRADAYADEANAAAAAVEEIARSNPAATPHAQIARASARVARIAADEGDEKQAKLSADRAVEVAVLAAAMPLAAPPPSMSPSSRRTSS
ncbi:hypothetical protein PG984_014962 [Apiospora sp. TS-2023a]